MTRLLSVSWSSCKESIRETNHKLRAPLLQIQIKRFAVVNGQLTKDDQQLSCLHFSQKEFRVPINTDDVVILCNKYDLVAINSQSGSLDKGQN